MKLKYQDKVMIKGGFYDGFRGVVIDFSKSLFKTEYKVITDVIRDGCRDHFATVWVDECNLIFLNRRKMKR